MVQRSLTLAERFDFGFHYFIGEEHQDDQFKLCRDEILGDAHSFGWSLRELFSAFNTYRNESADKSHECFNAYNRMILHAFEDLHETHFEETMD